MRGVEVRASLLMCAGAALLLLSAGEPVSASEAPAGLAPEAGDADDYYTRRARRILGTEKARIAKPHPLAASYPGMDIVVCEAGCRDQGTGVVFMRKQVTTTESREAMMVPTSDTASLGAYAGSDVTCIAGCYGETGAAGSPPPQTGLRVERMDLPARDKLSPVR